MIKKVKEFISDKSIKPLFEVIFRDEGEYIETVKRLSDGEHFHTEDIVQWIMPDGTFYPAEILHFNEDLRSVGIEVNYQLITISISELQNFDCEYGDWDKETILK